MDPPTLLRELVNHRVPLLCWASGWPGYEVKHFSDVSLNEDAQRIIHDAADVGIATNVFGLIAIDDAAAVAIESDCIRRWDIGHRSLQNTASWLRRLVYVKSGQGHLTAGAVCVQNRTYA